MKPRIAGIALATLVGLISLAFGAHAETVLTNPLGEGVTDINVLIGRVIQAALGFTGALALLMFVWGGIQMMTAAGTADKVKKGKQTLIWASIGLVVIFTSYVIVRAIITALTTGVIK